MLLLISAELGLIMAVHFKRVKYTQNVDVGRYQAIVQSRVF